MTTMTGGADGRQRRPATGTGSEQVCARRQPAWLEQKSEREVDFHPTGPTEAPPTSTPVDRRAQARPRRRSSVHILATIPDLEQTGPCYKPLAWQKNSPPAPAESIGQDTQSSPPSASPRCPPTASSAPTGKSRSQRRGSRFETTSLKLNRLFESSLSMLPQTELARTTDSYEARGGRREYLPSWLKSVLPGGELKAVAEESPQPSAIKSGLLQHSPSLCRRYRQQAERQRSGKTESRPDERAHDDDEDSDGLNVDGGYAWIILVVMFVINASTFGTARAYGLIFDKLARVDEQTRAEAALPFTIMGAIENMAGPLSGCLLAKTSSWRLTVFVGSFMVCLAHMLAALTADSQVGQLLSMGLMCGLGMSFVSISFFQVNNAYFVRYRNRAFGVSMTGAAFGTLYISPLCQHFLDNYEGTGMCYLMLGCIVLPNVPLSLLLKPKRTQTSNPVAQPPHRPPTFPNGQEAPPPPQDKLQPVRPHLKTISSQVESQSTTRPSIVASVKMVVLNPLFHLIWPTQLLFCWFNFVFGMIIVDFGKDRGLNSRDVANLVPVWAFGQLIGRLILSTLVDLKFLSYRSFTVICFSAISVTTFALNNTRIHDSEPAPDTEELSIVVSFIPPASRQHLLILTLVLILSMFIALLYILLNGLVVNYVEKSLQPLSIGISSFTGSFFLLPRAYVIGYYRDIIGNYDAMLTMFTIVSLCAALTWLLVPTTCKYLRKLYDHIMDSSHLTSRGKTIPFIQSCSTRPFATGKS